jgi:pyridinium-3,5-bisthiocarboxylic acid mononucleotide nickel chelatase
VPKRLHLDCFSGISGDMTLAALLDLGVPEEVVQSAVHSLGLPGQLRVERIRKAGFASVKIFVETPHEHSHRHLSHIVKMIDQATMTAGAREIAKRMFQKLGEAEAASHGIAIEKVHFHEVGAVDSIFDFVGIAVAIDWLRPERITSSPVPTGSGFVRCDHGLLPVPAPAVARLLTGIPLAPSTIESELTTPTGAAVLATLVTEFTRTVPSLIEKVGIGAGTKDFPEQPNILRVFLGEEAAVPSTDTVWQLESNIDDMPGEILGYTMERLLDVGALDAYLVPIHMKKNRPAVILSVLCTEQNRSAIEQVIFAETATLGIRRTKVDRTKLQRESVTVMTPWGAIAGKVAWNDSMKVFTPEYEACAKVARENQLPLRQVYDAVRAGWKP